MKKEYMAKIWGGAWNDGANPSIEKDLGIKKGYHYFDTIEDLGVFTSKLRNEKYINQGLMISLKEGELTHKKTMFYGKYQYLDKTFCIEYDFGYEYEKEDAIFMFLEGNNACDCNISNYIRRKYGEDSIPELSCGDDIKLLDYDVRFEDCKYYPLV